ncbi:unnamed protein product [Didymodactylos carnosus]|uniref:Uncharacterized protein n=1 Tax=Didymodactylos carnosus TaxID=1234261 RepID=A0A815GMD8_9BILA|nr:unnamed protein product [Didymodactylos carnosus]CAF4203889.1 unnamed protein product [Didymodactylos carnosus]
MPTVTQQMDSTKQRDNGQRTGAKTASGPRSARGPMDGTAPAQTNGYKGTLPYATPMLTQKQKDARVQWAIQHKDDDWSRTIFTDEIC